MTAPRRRLAAVLLAGAALVAGCSGSSNRPAATPNTAIVAALPAGAQFDVKVTPSKPQSDQTCSNGYPATASLAPSGPLPPAGQMPPGTFMAAIAARGSLIAGVDQNSYLWGYRDPSTGKFSGFDIDMVDQVAAAIFGPNWQSQHRVQYVVVPNVDRQKAVATGQVDLVAETMTINCARQEDQPWPVDFSAEYYDAYQGVLVPNGSPISSVAGLAGHTVCAESGSTSLQNLARSVPAARLVAVANWTDCLVLLQQGQVDAISTDDTILEGLAQQDPNDHLLDLPHNALSDEPYGMAISKSHPDFTRFVNAVLDQERSDGTWATIWTDELRKAVQTTPPPPPPALYRD